MTKVKLISLLNANRFDTDLNEGIVLIEVQALDLFNLNASVVRVLLHKHCGRVGFGVCKEIVFFLRDLERLRNCLQVELGQLYFVGDVSAKFLAGKMCFCCTNCPMNESCYLPWSRKLADSLSGFEWSHLVLEGIERVQVRPKNVPVLAAIMRNPRVTGSEKYISLLVFVLF